VDVLQDLPERVRVILLLVLYNMEYLISLQLNRLRIMGQQMMTTIVPEGQASHKTDSG
jgi:hypothetical protein